MDVVDPVTNRQYKVAYTASYRGMGYPGDIGARLAGTAPTAGWRPLIDLP
jgi:hypothetical protein